MNTNSAALKVTVQEMDLRDYFAAKILPAMYAHFLSDAEDVGWEDEWAYHLALDVYMVSNAMMKARKL